MSVFDFFIVTYQIKSFYCRKGLELSLNAVRPVFRFTLDFTIDIVLYFRGGGL